jgi:MoaA/NifB/PqqE/SkfB family radical SAM enzyme
LLDIIDYARVLFPNANISITTNGVLLDKMEDNFWFTCSQNKITITLSQYPIYISIDKVIAKAQQNNVRLQYAMQGKEKSYKAMWKYPLDLDGKQSLKNSYKLCNQLNNCIRLQDGKIYPCETIAAIKHFNCYFNRNLVLSAEDTLDIYKISNISEVFDFLVTPKPFCRNCNKKNVQFGLKWKQSERDISEWT